MRPDAKLGLFVFLVLVISVFFLVAHELSQRQPTEPADEISSSGATAGDRIPAVDTAGTNSEWPAEPVAATGSYLPAVSSPAATASGDTLPPASAPAVAAPYTGAGSGFGVANDYVVQKGDTLWVIAKKVYGKGSQWRRIYDANRDRLASPEAMLKLGMKLSIPEAEFAAPAPEASPMDPYGSQMASVGSGRTHVVASGESLYTIAKKYYGSGEKAKTDMIYTANQDRMRSPDMLKVGMSLSIPETAGR